MLHLYRSRPIAAGAAAGLLAALLVAGILLWRGPAIEAGTGDPFAEPDSAAASADSGGSVWGADYFTNVPLVTHEGERIRFFDDMLRDKVVLINFIYTSCPDTCPMETARLLEVARILGNRMGEDVFFYSVTVDPETDTPEVLADFAANWGIPEGWKFVTGDPDDLVVMRKKLGIDIRDVESLTLSQHPISLVMGNQATGRWMKRSPFENSYILADQVGRWLHNWSLPSVEERDYADAPEIRQISSGEDLFRTRCAACHTIGDGDVRELAERRIGPDLYNVGESRDRAWLERWLKEPDKMLAEKDPLAMALFAQYNEIPMPNLRLTDSDVTKILGYMDHESRRITAVRAGKDPHAGHAGHGAKAADAGHDAHTGHGTNVADAGHEAHAGDTADAAHGAHTGHQPEPADAAPHAGHDAHTGHQPEAAAAAPHGEHGEHGAAHGAHGAAGGGR